MNNDSYKYYGDIINMPHRVSNIHAPMNILNRAAQFAPFSALPVTFTNLPPLFFSSSIKYFTDT